MKSMLAKQLNQNSLLVGSKNKPDQNLANITVKETQSKKIAECTLLLAPTPKSYQNVRLKNKIK